MVAEKQDGGETNEALLRRHRLRRAVAAQRRQVRLRHGQRRERLAVAGADHAGRLATAGTAPGRSSPTRLGPARPTDALAAGHTVSARRPYLRAAEYFRQAFFFHRDDLDVHRAAQRLPPALVRAFRSAFAPPRPTPAASCPGRYRVILARYLCAPGGPADRVPDDPPRRRVRRHRRRDCTPAVAPGARSRLRVRRPRRPRNRRSVLYDRAHPDAARLGETSVPGDGRPIAGACPEVVSGAHRPRRAVVRRADRTPRRVRANAALAALIVDPGQWRHRVVVASTGSANRWPSWLDDSSADPQFEARCWANPAMKALLDAPDGDQRGDHHRPLAYSRDMRRYNSVGHRRQDQLARPTSRTTTTDDQVSTGPGQDPVRPPHQPEGVSACSPRPKEPRAIARAWPRSCSGRRVQLAGLVARRPAEWAGIAPERMAPGGLRWEG